MFSRLLFVAICITFGSLCVLGQDLGSSNKLFGGGKTSGAKTTAKKTVKKAPAKHRAAASKAKTPARTGKASAKNIKPVPHANTASNSTTSTKTAANKMDSGKGAVQTSKVDSSRTRPRDFVIPSGKAADDLYEKLLAEGNTARDERDYTNAEIAYQHAKAIKSRDSRAIYGLGNLYGDQMRWEDAEEAYRAALKIEPNDATAYIALSFVLTQPIPAPNLSDRYEEAEKLARKAIELTPSNSLAFDQLGVALELRGLIGAETENAYRRSIKLDPSFAPAYAHLGRLLRRRGLGNESAVAYQDAVRRSTDVPTMILVADVMQSEQRYVESELLLRRALAIDTRNPAALLMLGRALTTQGNFSEAEGMLKKSLAVMPNGFVPNSLLGSLYARQGKFEAAENALLQALRFVSPNEKRPLSLQFEAVGDGYLKAGKARQAERVYLHAIALDGERESLSAKLARARHG